MIAERDYYLTPDGRAVAEEELETGSLLVGRGCEIPDAIARKHGLLPADPEPELSVPQVRVMEGIETREDMARRVAREEIAAALEAMFPGIEVPLVEGELIARETAFEKTLQHQATALMDCLKAAEDRIAALEARIAPLESPADVQPSDQPEEPKAEEPADPASEPASEPAGEPVKPAKGKK